MKIQQSSLMTNNLSMSRERGIPIKRIQSSNIRNKSRLSGIFNENISPESGVCSRILIKEKILAAENNNLNNLCFDDCPNINLIKKYEQDLKDLIESNINLKKMNEYLLKTISIKDDLFIDVTNENKNLRLDNNILNSHIGSKRILSGRQCQIRNNFKNSFISECFDNVNNKSQNGCKNSSVVSANKHQQVYNCNSNKFDEKNNSMNNSNFGNSIKMKKNNKSEIISNEIYFVNNYQKNNNLNTFLTLASGQKKKNSQLSNFNHLSEISNKKVKDDVTSNLNTNSNTKMQNYTSLIRNFNNKNVHLDDNEHRTFLENQSKQISSILQYNSNPGSAIKPKNSNTSNIFIKEHSNNQIHKISDNSINQMTKINSNNNNIDNISNSNNQNTLIHNYNHISPQNNQENIQNTSSNNTSSFATQQKKHDFYERISNLVSKNNNKNMKFKNKARSSLLGLNDDMLSKIISTEVIANLKKITLNDEEFIDFFRTTSEDKLIAYCDAIYQLIRDLESAIKLIQRMRSYIMITSKLVNCSLVEEIAAAIIKDACLIMDCDRTSIFMYDILSDMLVVHTGEGLKRNEIRIGKNIGIIGSVFMKGEIIRVDDAYSDSRFSRDFDKKSNYITKTILAAPLKDSSGVTFGVIQSINKNNNSKFTDDDEELIHLFSMHISQIMKTAKTNDENISYIAKLKMIISFKEDILKIKNLVDLSNCIDQMITNIFSTQYSQILFYNENKNNLVKISKYEKSEKNKNIGIVGYVFEKKEFFGINSSNGCEFYNNLVDIETGMSILTYPIISNGNVKAILQFSYNDKLIHFKKPKEIDEQIIKYIIFDCGKWFALNEDILKNSFN